MFSNWASGTEVRTATTICSAGSNIIPKAVTRICAKDSPAYEWADSPRPGRLDDLPDRLEHAVRPG